MKKKITVIMLTLTAIGLVCLTGCTNTGYQPGSNESYYEIDGVYRVIKLKNSEPEKIENLPITSITLKSKNVSQIVAQGYGYEKNSIFFSDIEVLNKKGVEQLYKLLGINLIGELNEYYKNNDNTGLKTYNKKRQYSTIIMTVPQEKLDDGYMLMGLAMTADKYIIDYEDRLKQDGKVIRNGEFEIYVIGNTLIDYYKID